MGKIKFKSSYQVYDKIYSPAGSDDVADFGYVKEVNKDSGVEEIVFKQVGSHSQSEYINSFADSVDLRKLMERYQAGDITVLTKRVGEYIDSIGLPDNLLDAKLMIENGTQAFNDLPVNIKEQYDNDPMKFIKACEDGSIKNIITELDEYSKKASFDNLETTQALNESNKKIEELQAQIAELKGVKYE